MARAVALTEKILNESADKFEKVNIIPSSGGVFEIKLDDKLLFSKKELERFPEEDEAEKLIKENLT